VEFTKNAAAVQKKAEQEKRKNKQRTKVKKMSQISVFLTLRLR
jgi:DNA-binding transcriptional regulator WhiA